VVERELGLVRIGRPWRDIGGVFPAGAPVAAVSRNRNQLDVFVCGLDGRVYTSWWSSGSDWSGLGDHWRNIGAPIGPPPATIGALGTGPISFDGDVPVGGDSQLTLWFPEIRIWLIHWELRSR
jgi:hypothetical protein